MAFNQLSRRIVNCSQLLRYRVWKKTLKMSSIDGSTHMEKTENSPRNEVVSQATLVQMEQISPDVKSLFFRVHDKMFTFRPGQWIDMMIPEIEVVGGFSLCSSPFLLQKENLIQLAVQYSTHPPALWIHTKCKVGDVVKLRCGGNFYFDFHKTDKKKHLLLIAGGVGINPICSIVRDLAEHIIRSRSDEYRALLLYSGKSRKNLLFKEELMDIAKKVPSISCKFFATRETCQEQEVLSHRIDPSVLRESVLNLNISKMQTYICGPPPMIESVASNLLQIGLAEDDIKYEKWW
ncbi:Oxidoreductase NAD-binding domain-containing protein 1 [Trichoplax sp. H2]|nr:Oxidoreductase NAD-binding domain-containing protein 1 [Trichoplax sp. H2]|eukprot:RDD42780.1 Oxidoreductase NAD-binding domain-containing protein 1 [Trichoplax sp. H2]